MMAERVKEGKHVKSGEGVILCTGQSDAMVLTGVPLTDSGKWHLLRD